MPYRVRQPSPSYWIKRHRKHGDKYVGNLRRLASHATQTERLFEVGKSVLSPTQHALDFGCGVGRFQPLLYQVAEEVSALDVVPLAVEQVKQQFPQTHARSYREVPFPFKTATFDLIWSCTVLQHLVEEPLFQQTCRELHRVARSGAKFVLLEACVAGSSHVRAWSPEEYEKALGIQIERADQVDAAGKCWLIVGRSP